MTYEEILNRKIRRVPPDLDTREGSPIRTLLAPTAIEQANLYTAIEYFLDQVFADTAGRENLIRLASERGITPWPATKAVWRGEFNIDVPIGSRFSMGTLDYTVIEHISSGVAKLECDSTGAVGNTQSGDLVPIEYIQNLNYARLTELLIPGDDVESTESLRARYFADYDAKAYAFNAQGYKDCVTGMPGVAGVKVYRTPNNQGGRVGLTIIDSQYGVPSQELLSVVQDAIDPIPYSGLGIGLAPIGHYVTVSGVQSEPVDITLNITFQEGWTWADVEVSALAAIDDYLLELRQEWASQDSLVVRISQIETRVLDLDGILDVADTEINGAQKNHALSTDVIPERGNLTWIEN